MVRGLSDRIVLRPETANDLAFRLALFEAVRGVEWAGITLPPSLILHQVQAQAADHARRFPRVRLSIIALDGEPVGRLAVDHGERALRLIDIAILPERQGLGVGAHLVRGLLDEASAHGLEVHLGTAIANDGARRLYERLGFAVVSRTDTDVEMAWSAA